MVHRNLIAWGPRAPSLERGQALGLIDRFSAWIWRNRRFAEADVIVIGAPPVATAELVTQRFWIWRRLQVKQPVVTDMASIKGVDC